MSKICLSILMALALAGMGCGYGSRNYMGGPGGPHIGQLMPANALHGGSDFVLTVNGTGFGMDSVVYWGMSPKTTTFVSATQVTADISASDITSAGSVYVYVRSGGNNSNQALFTIQ